MLHVIVDDPRPNDGCMTCCCETVHLKPGETQPLYLNYVGWAVPIAPRGLHCAPSVQIEEKDTCLMPAGSNLPPQIISTDGMVRYHTGKNVKLTDDLKTKVSDPEGVALKFEVLPLYAPKHGKLVLDPGGSFTYEPMANYIGEERFYCSASDGAYPPFIFEVMIAVEIDAGVMAPASALMVGSPQVNSRMYTVMIPLTASPAAKTCQVFRLTVLQGALDCECNCFTNITCVDVRIVKC